MAENCQYAHSETELALIETFWKSKEEAEQKRIEVKDNQ